MPREIADSDAESDTHSPSRPSVSPIPENVVEEPPLSMLENDPFANLEFDQFLSPTQRLSSAIERHEAAQSRSVSSTDRFLQDVAHIDQQQFDSTANTQRFDSSLEGMSSAITHSKVKRTLSDIEGGQTGHGRSNGSQERAMKRAKTDEGSWSQRSDIIGLLSRTDNGQVQEMHTSRGLPLNDTIPPEALIRPLITSPNAPNSRSHEVQNFNVVRNYHQPGATAFLQSNLQNILNTKSFIGGYEGINMDFRGAGLSLDMNANPFGSLSQVSLDNEVNPLQAEKFASLFHHSQDASESAPAGQEDAVEFLSQSACLGEMATSSVGKEAQSRSTPLAEHDEAEEEAQQVEAVRAAPKKRGRKPKSAQNVTSVTQEANVTRLPQSENLLDTLHEQPEQHERGVHRPGRSRADTADSFNSHALQASQANVLSKKSRPKAGVDETASHTSSNPLNDLDFSDPAMVGVPKEMYVPRPSKSRSKQTLKAQIQDELQDQNEDSSSQKRLQTAVALEDDHATASRPASTPVKKKAGKKGKVKRAKTSAAALLKSAEMYDEDDKDCIILDEVPSKVKMAPLPEISPLKREDKGDPGTSLQQVVDQEHESPTTNRKQSDETVRAPKLSIDIPTTSKPDEPELVSLKPAPKKRGRKAKKKVDVHVEDEIHQGVDVGPNLQLDTESGISQTSKARSALVEKTTNTPSPSHQAELDVCSDEASKSVASPPFLCQGSGQGQQQAESPCTSIPSPKKPVHSPLKPTPQRASLTPSAISTISSSLWTKPRVGLSRRTTIPSLLRKLDRTKEPPKTVERKEKLNKRQQEEEERRRLEAEDAGEEYDGGQRRWEMRGKDGMLLEWDE